MSTTFLQAKHSNESRSWSSFFGVVQIRRIIFPHFGQQGRSATLSGNATVMKGTIQPERDSSLYVPTPAIRHRRHRGRRVASNRAAARELLSCDGVFASAAMETVSWSEAEYLSMTLSCRPSRFATTYVAMEFWLGRFPWWALHTSRIS
jgi:hypothetical protein